jgi:hypothetical protein
MNPKWSSKFELKPGRWVFVPTDETVDVGNEIKSAIEERWSAPSFFYHLRAGGHVAAVRAHLESKAFLRLDIQDFFGSIGRSRVARSLRTWFSHANALEWAHASTVADPSDAKRTIIPFGFVQSPIVASLCLADSAFGSFLRKLAKSKQIKVSVYVDDIILSSQHAEVLSQDLVEKLASIAKRSRFAFSAEKSQGPAPAIKAFNIELCHESMRIEEGRMDEFIAALKSSDSPPQRAGILGYIGSVNADQGTQAAKEV